MAKIIKTGHSVDEAVTEALVELGLTSDQVEIEVLEKPPSGLLGLFSNKMAKVSISTLVDLEDIAREFLNDVFEKMNIKVNIDIKRKENNMHIELSGDNMGVLIGKRGQTLDAFQYLVSLVVNKESDHYIRIKMDTENYRARRKKTLENLARSLGNKVKRTNKKFKLEPMNPYERRIIHSTLQNVKNVETHSEGEDPYRRVIIVPKK